MELVAFPDGHTVHRTHLWLTHAEGGIAVHLDEPTEPSLALADLKAWCISAPTDQREFKIGERVTSVSAADVLSKYVAAVLERAGIRGSAEHRISALMPALSSQQHQQTYRDMLVTAVQRACPNASVSTLTESEMVLEYFHLFKGSLRLRREDTNVFLVVDAGAATTNFTIVLSTKAGRITQATKANRPTQLRPVSADAPVAGGTFIDRWLLDHALANRGERTSVASEAAALRAIERAKLDVARGAASQVAFLGRGRAVTITAELVTEAAAHLWRELRPTYLDVATRLLEQLRSGAKATAYQMMLQKRNVAAPADVARLFDAVFVAGGTSLCPGFEDGLRDAIGASPDLHVHSIGGAYPVAAVLGAIAHLSAGSRATSQRANAATELTQLQASLAWDVYLDSVDDQHGTPSSPNFIHVLQRNDELLGGGNRPVALPTSWKPGMSPRARLVHRATENPADDRELRKGLRRTVLSVRSAAPQGRIVVDREREVAHLESDSIIGIEKVSIPLTARAAHEQRVVGLMSETVALDIGMSKTVIARTSARQPAPVEFEEAYRWVPDVPGYSLDAASGDADASDSSSPRSRAYLSPLDLADPVARLREVAARAAARGAPVDEKLLAVVYLGICTRRFVLLAGPPGSGKSTLARTLAEVLGCVRGRGLVDISVQAHWIDDGPLRGPGAPLADPLPADSPALVLLDEINLARPEYYLQDLFGSFDRFQEPSSLCLVGTLNVDEVSRPPSPKVLDRSMLFVVPPARRGATSLRSGWTPAPAVSGDSPEIGQEAVIVVEPDEQASALVGRWIDAAYECAASNAHLRADILPSARAHHDLLYFATLHGRLGMDALISFQEAMDYAILGRLIAPLNGSEEEVLPLVERWVILAGGDDQLPALPAVRRRLERMRHQAHERGHVHFWQ